MSEEAIGEGIDDDLEPTKKLSGKKIVLFIVLPLLLLGGGGAGVMFSGVLGDKAEATGDETAKAEDKAPPAPAKTVFYELPEMVVNLNSQGRRPNFLKIKVSLELNNESDIGRLETLRPRIIDNFQVYLRELRIDDLRGSAGIYRLREELLARVNASVQPTKVVDVLFKEVLVQ